MKAQITILGYCGAEINKQTLYNGTEVLRFSVATQDEKDKDGNTVASWYNCAAFGMQANNLEKYLGKGTQVLIIGKIQMRPYKDKNGNTMVSNSVTVDSFQIVGGGSNKQERRAEAKPAARAYEKKVANDEGDDLPF